MQDVSLTRLRLSYVPCRAVSRRFLHISRPYDAVNGPTRPSLTGRHIAISVPLFSNLRKKGSRVNHDIQDIANIGSLPPRVGDTQDIIVNDLAATLEAHRARNRAIPIRKVQSTERYEASKEDCESSQEAHVVDGLKRSVGSCEESRSHIPQWPADSLQAMRAGKRGTPPKLKGDEILEYEAFGHVAYGKWSMQTTLGANVTRPWLLFVDQANDDPYETLSHEISAFETFMRLSPAEEAASKQVFAELTATLQPRYRCILMGSRSTGLETPISDLDVSIELNRSQPGQEWEVPTAKTMNGRARKTSATLLFVREILKASRNFSSIHLVHARVPIIRAKHAATGLELQLQTMTSYESQQAFTKAFLEQLPSLRPLYISLRYALIVRNLTKVYEGGLGSYALLIMIVTALKHARKQFEANDLASQLLHVLDFWGNANLYDNAFSVNPPQVFSKKQDWTVSELIARSENAVLSSQDKMEKYDPRKPYLLCLQDPANYDNDLGRKTYAIKHIQKTFQHAHKTMSNLISVTRSTPREKLRQRGQSLLGPLLQADYRYFKQYRSRVERSSKPINELNLDHDPQDKVKDIDKEVVVDKTGHSSNGVDIRFVADAPDQFRRKLRRGPSRPSQGSDLSTHDIPYVGAESSKHNASRSSISTMPADDALEQQTGGFASASISKIRMVDSSTFKVRTVGSDRKWGNVHMPAEDLQISGTGTVMETSPSDGGEFLPEKTHEIRPLVRRYSSFHNIGPEPIPRVTNG